MGFLHFHWTMFVAFCRLHQQVQGQVPLQGKLVQETITLCDARWGFGELEDGVPWVTGATQYGFLSRGSELGESSQTEEIQVMGGSVNILPCYSDHMDLENHFREVIGTSKPTRCSNHWVQDRDGG